MNHFPRQQAFIKQLIINDYQIEILKQIFVRYAVPADI